MSIVKIRISPMMSMILRDSNTVTRRPLREKRRGFFFAQNSQKFTLFHKNHRDKNILFYEENRVCLKCTILFIFGG